MKISLFFRKLIVLALFAGSIFLITFNHMSLEGPAQWINLGMVFLVLSFIAFIPSKFDYILATILLSILSLYFGVQTIYFRAFQQYGFFSMLLTLKDELIEFSSSAFELLQLSDLRYILVPIFFFGISIQLSRVSSKKYQTSHKLYLTLVIIVLSILSFGQYIEFKNDISTSSKEENPVYIQQTDFYIYQAVPNTNNFVDTFGLLGLGIRDLTSYFYNPFLQQKGVEEQISTFLSLRQIPTTSEYSALFKDKSLLLIEAESLVNFAIDEKLTPTLYRLLHQGFAVNGYNSPLLLGSTSDTEFMANTSLLPAQNGSITFEVYANHIYPVTLANEFKAEGYFTMASHNNYGVYYNRENMLPHLGYTFFDAIALNAYDNVEDSYVIDRIKWIMYEQGRYLSFWITFNAHQPYDYESLTPLIKEYFAIVDATYPDYPTDVKVYLAKNMDLDQGLKQLIKDYSHANVINDLVIVIYGDHYPKGIFMDKLTYEEVCAQRGYTLERCFNTPLIIWNDDTFVGSIEKVSSPLDIAPTIYDLFGISYDYQSVLGHSVFDPSYDGFLFDEFNVIQTNSYVFDPLQDTVNVKGPLSEAEYRSLAYQQYSDFVASYQMVQMDYFK